MTRSAAVIAIPLVAAALFGSVFGLAGRAGVWAWAAYTGAGLLLVVAIVFQVVARLRAQRREQTLRTARERLELRLRDELMPWASTLADMPTVPFADRIAYLKPVAVQAVAALWALTEDHVDRLRANIYLLDADSQQMESLAHTGRGERPQPFVAGTPRGDNALEFVAGTKTAFYPDLRRERPDGYDGTMSGYDTFIAVPIWTDNGHYGMVTVDAPAAGSLTLGDVSLAELVAELMTIPFEIAQDGSAAEPPPARGRAPRSTTSGSDRPGDGERT